MAAPGASGVRAGPASPPLCEAPTAGFLGGWAWASRDTTQEHLPARLYPVTTAESREVPCLSCTPDGSLESPCQTSDCCSTGRHVECQCPRLAPVPGLRCPRTTGSRLQLAVSVSSELKSWPRRVLAEVLLAGHFTICAAPGASGVRAGPASPPLCEAPTAGFLGAWAWASRDTTQEHLPARLYPVTTAESREVPCLSCTPDGSLESPCQTSDCCSTGRHVECQVRMPLDACPVAHSLWGLHPVSEVLC
nr:uncharacterized protein LOC127492593 isoform X5 [Oryctolagus cuniculus]